MSTSDSPALILWTFLVAQQGFLKTSDVMNRNPPPKGVPLVVGPMPDPLDTVVALQNAAGRKDGKTMQHKDDSGNVTVPGATLFHPGVMLRVRAKDDNEANAIGTQIENVLDTVQNEQVQVGKNQYTLAAVSIRGNLSFIGEEKNLRRVYTMNTTLTVSLNP